RLDAIRAKLEANAELTKDVLGKELSEQDFAKRMLSQLKKLKFEEIKEEFDKLVKQIDTFVPINIEATKAQLKRYGDELQTEISKKQRIDVSDTEEKIETDKEELVEAMNPTPLDTKSNIVANWKIFQQAMLKDFTREDLIELYWLVMQKYGTNRHEDAYDRVLWNRKYPLSKDACQVMLKMKLLDGKMNEVCYKLLKMIKKQAGVKE
ncbi:hypothetical protein Tco_0305225, partial [Tanacetum coccineum]